MRSSTFFSVVLPTYNRAHLIKKAIESVLQQTNRDWELLIIDDGSTDNTREVVEQFPDNRIRYIYQQNAERSAARNKGISLATGEFICFLDSDDQWRSNHLQTHLEAIEANGKKQAFYFTGMAWNFPDHKEDVIFEPLEGKNPVEYVIKNQIGTPTICIHRSILSEEQFNPGMRINEDVELFARIAAKFELIRIPVITLDVIVHDMNTRGLEKNYITPQIKAMELIFNNPALKLKISSPFKRDRFRDLQHQLVNHYYNTGEYGKMNQAIFNFLIRYPFHFQNKSKIVLLLYHLPGGGLLQKLVGKLKR